MISSLIIAQADGGIGAGIGGVPAEFVKNFIIMFAFVTVGGGMYLFGRRGSKANPVHLHQPVSVDATVKAAPNHAHQSAVDELRERMEAMALENLREHNSHRAAQAAMMKELMERGNDREMKIISAINNAKDTITRETLNELKEIHKRLNPVEAAVAALQEGLGTAKASIRHIKEELLQLWEILRSKFSSAPGKK